MQEIKTFFDKRTFTLTYVVFDTESRDAVIIDPVLDYQRVGSKLWHESVNQLTDFIKESNLNVRYILETHAHADHLSSSQVLKERFPEARLGIGAGITAVQDTFKGFFGLHEDFPTDGSQFDRLLQDGEEVEAGSLRFKVIATPGHTPACVSYLFDKTVFTGDALFMPDFGTGRCDFPLGSARNLFQSITQGLYTLPEETRVFTGHDYSPGGRKLRFESTIGEEKADNIQLPDGRSEEDFVKFRTERDAGLNAPKLLFQSVQVNIDAGRLPPPEANGKRYLKAPLNIADDG